MERVIDTTEVVGAVAIDGESWDVRAAAIASYDDATSRLCVSLDAFLRVAGLRAREKRLAAAWLPKPETVSEHVRRDEALDVAREIFHRWVRRVREAIPAPEALEPVQVPAAI